MIRSICSTGFSEAARCGHRTKLPWGLKGSPNLHQRFLLF